MTFMLKKFMKLLMMKWKVKVFGVLSLIVKLVKSAARQKRVEMTPSQKAKHGSEKGGRV